MKISYTHGFYVDNQRTISKGNANIYSQMIFVNNHPFNMNITTGN